MKKLSRDFGIIAISLCCLHHGAFANIQFQLGPTHLEAIHIKENIDFSVTTGGNDASFVLALKDAYLSETTIPSYSLSDTKIFDNANATLNGSIQSDASKFATFLDTGIPLPDTIDMEATDILVQFYFSSYSPLSSPWSLSMGDTITIEAGSIFDLTDFDIPNPDNLSSEITAQIFSANFPIAFSDEQTLTVVPEQSMLAACFGAFALTFTLLQRRSRTSRT